MIFVGSFELNEFDSKSAKIIIITIKQINQLICRLKGVNVNDFARMQHQQKKKISEN